MADVVPASVLVVDDDAPVRRMLERTLAAEGYAVVAVADGGSALARAEAAPPDAIVLDVAMPGMDGLAVARRLRSKGVSIPILMLTARDEVGDRVAGLDAGADDYLVKPFAVPELAARMRALLRRTRPADVRGYADLVFDPGTRMVERGGRSVELTAREADLLEVLMRRPGHVVTRRAALSAVWGDSRAVSDNVVDRYIAYLRRKLGDPPLIHTVRGAGYVLRR
jgi:two-component system, OmpR family, response regulator MprA